MLRVIKQAPVKGRYAVILIVIVLHIFHANTELFAQVKSDSTKEEKAKTISGFLKFGISGSSGNVSRSSSSYAFELERKTKLNAMTLDGNYYAFRSKGEKLDENLYFSLLNIFEISKKNHLYAKGSFFRNVFQGFDRQWKIGGGYLRSIGDKKHGSLSLRVGYQLRESEVTKKSVGEYNQGYHNFSLIGFMLRFILAENITLKSKFDYEHDMNLNENFNVQSNSDLVFTVNKWLDLILIYQYFYDGLPVLGKKSKDERLEFSLQVKF